MTGTAERREPEIPPGCAEAGCERESAFWAFDRDVGCWRSVCDRHARHLHPSLELRAWLASGYLRPIVRGHPNGPPPVPDDERARAFREEVDALLDWSG